MKILLINGSPRADGNTAFALRELAGTLQQEGLETQIVCLGSCAVRGCVACGTCKKTGKCIFTDDPVNETAEKFKQADGLVVASPVYYASANGTLISFLDRLFHSTSFDKTMKIGASIAVCRRSGATATFDQLNKYFTISGMPVVSSQYWNNLHGREKGESALDEEGLQTMRTLGRNIAFLVKSIALGKEKIGLPRKEEIRWTHFIRK
jgi:multimeric flavodoxin WrbA